MENVIVLGLPSSVSALEFMKELTHAFKDVTRSISCSSWFSLIDKYLKHLVSVINAKV